MKLRLVNTLATIAFVPSIFGTAYLYVRDPIAPFELWETAIWIVAPPTAIISGVVALIASSASYVSSGR